MEHVAADFVLFEHRGDGFGGVDRGLTTPATFGVRRQRLFEFIGQADVIDDQPTRLVAEDSVHASDGLHQAVAAHRLVEVHGMQARSIKAGQPHIADEDDSERVFRVFESLRVGAEITVGCS